MPSRSAERGPPAREPPLSGQFALLVVTNAFVGGMVGLERTVLPLLARDAFGIASAAAAVAFIATFGVSKAVFNLLAGPLADRYGRRRVLLAGWLIGLPVPLVLLWAPAWGYVLGANVLLGINQALAWSMTINMKFDLVGERRRGLAAGLNEFAGYGGLALVALATGVLAARAGLRPAPFLLGLAIAVVGLALSLAVRETRAPQGPSAPRVPLAEAFARGTFRERRLATLSLAGLLTNLKDGALWGLLPLILLARGFGIEAIGLVVAVYPAVWGVGQVVFGPLSDRIGRLGLVVGGLALQGAGVVGLAFADALPGALAGAVAAGLGTAMVYPTLQAFVSDLAAPAWRASALGVYRFWRDAGYAVGAVAAGLLADAIGFGAAVGVLGALVALGALVVWAGARESAPGAPVGPSHL